MTPIKTIAIVGATGNMGSAIAKSLAKNGAYRLLLMANDQEKLVNLKTALEKTTPAEIFAISCAREASWEADIIILALPDKDKLEVASTIRDVATGKVVVSIANGESSRAEVGRLFPYSSFAEIQIGSSWLIAGTGNDRPLAEFLNNLGGHAVIESNLT